MEEKTVDKIRHGGREVLRIVLPCITGDTPLSQHAQALVGALREYAERVLAPLAVRELEEAVQNGRGYAFFSHRYEAFFSYERKKGRIFATLTARHTVRGEERAVHVLPMVWTADAVWQIKKRG